MSSRPSPGALADALEALPVCVVSLEVRQARIAVADYPGGWRPTSVVCLSGEGHTGFGENVAFTSEEHTRFAARAADWFAAEPRARPQRVATVLSTLPVSLPVSLPAPLPVSAAAASLTPHERAALEAAILDLGMRQAATSFRELTGSADAALRFVRSFAAGVAPLECIQRWRARGYTGALKIDVDSRWDRSTCERLAREPGIAILDFKGHGDIAFAQELAALFPGAIFEDPPPGPLPVRVSRDAVLGDTRAVSEALARGEAVNLKAPRMGGPLAVLRALELALAEASTPPGGAPGPLPSTCTGVTAYLGGMFEVGVGRAQARQLAALYCAEAPNDLALNVDPGRGVLGSGVDAPSAVLGTLANSEFTPLETPPVTVRFDLPGFG